MKLTKIERRRWRTLIANLRRLSTSPTVVKTIRLDYDGLIARHKTHYLIKVSSMLSFQQRCETLAHEWAHVLDNFERHCGDEDKQHSETWGVYYSACYRLALKEILA